MRLSVVPSSLSSDKIDKLFRIIQAVLIVAILVVGVLFALAYRNTRAAATTATPALRAIESLKQQVKAAPNNAALRVRLGESLASAGLYRDAIDQLKSAIRIDAKHSGAYLDLGVISLEQNERKAAEGYFLKVVDLTKVEAFSATRREVALFYLGELALDERRYEEAVGFFKEALRLRKDASDTYFELAIALRGLSRDDEALEQLDIALAFDPSYAEAHFAMGEIYLDRKEKVNAAIHLTKAAELAPDADPPKEALEPLGTAEEAVADAEDALAKGRLPEAIEFALLARALDASSVKAVLVHAKTLEADGDKKAALAAYKAADVLAPKDADIDAAIKRLSSK